MEKITLYSAGAVEATAVSNIFIDNYMPTANGSYVKVYLYLLRCLSSHMRDFSVSYLADQLEDTEKDIIRALKYWEKVKLIQLKYNGTGEITSITLKEPQPLEEHEACPAPVSPIPLEPSYEAQENPLQKSEPYVPERPIYTNEQITELSGNDEIKWTMNIIEIYLERPLKPKDIQLILYLYDSVHFSPELIMYLYEYCISKNKKNSSYIEAVALAWAEQGISTVDQAEMANTVYNTNYTAITKAFGLNRGPGAIEKEYIDKWLYKFGFAIEIIVEACNRTILNTQKADFKYADKILENWHANQVTKPEDIKRLDTAFNISRNVKVSPSVKDVQQKPSNNRFNAFPQRNYSKADYEDMEKRLLNRG